MIFTKPVPLQTPLRTSHRRCSEKKRCSYEFTKFHRKTPVLECLSNKVADLQACNFIKKRHQHRFFLVKFAKFWRTSILKKHLRTTTSVLPRIYKI